jgi:hypothetical protein
MRFRERRQRSRAAAVWPPQRAEPSGPGQVPYDGVLERLERLSARLPVCCRGRVDRPDDGDRQGLANAVGRANTARTFSIRFSTRNGFMSSARPVCAMSAV